jgi:hypothetical protein
MRKEESMIDISKFDKADVLRVLYNNSQPLGIGMLQFTPEDMTKEEAQAFLDAREEGKKIYFDYLKGRVLKVDLTGDELDPWLYDRDNGSGAAERAISKI